MLRLPKGILRNFTSLARSSGPPATPKSRFINQPSASDAIRLSSPKSFDTVPSKVSDAMTEEALLLAFQKGYKTIIADRLASRPPKDPNTDGFIRYIKPASKGWNAAKLLQVFDHGVKVRGNTRWSGVVEGKSGVKCQQAWRYVNSSA